jgi:RNA recognition motif-containing protein
MNTNLCKVFVGNVPFQCTQQEFRECFESMQGFIKAEVINKINTLASRGFGFVTFDSHESATALIESSSIVCKDRILRFTKYGFHSNSESLPHSSLVETNLKNIYIKASQSSNSLLSLHDNDNLNFEKKNEDDKYKNFIVVKNLKDQITRDMLQKIFEKYGIVGRHFIVSDHNTGSSKGYAIVEMASKSSYDLLIKLKELKIDDTCTLELSKWKQINITQSKIYRHNNIQVKSKKSKRIFY